MIKSNTSLQGVTDAKVLLREPFFKIDNNVFTSKKNNMLNKKNFNANIINYSTTVNFDDSTLPPLNLNTENLPITLLPTALLNMEDSYDIWSSLRLGLKKEMTAVHLKPLKHLRYISSTTVLNNFRADFDDFSFQIDSLKSELP